MVLGGEYHCLAEDLGNSEHDNGDGEGKEGSMALRGEEVRYVTLRYVALRYVTLRCVTRMFNL